ncbi:MAG TPA: DUF3108 domain-containing protein, partial [Gemmatimonadaceae bacterium]|nr:DUF3108 domain-containing protein [Gemmatimonadaceae bacterium]
MLVLLVRLASLATLVATLSSSATTIDSTSHPQDPQEGAAAAPRIPSVGERLAYDVKFSAVKVGSGFMETIGYEPVRGVNALHVRFTVRGGTFFYKVNDLLESWIDTTRFVSLRHKQD